METPLERTWSALETFFTLTQARIQEAVAQGDRYPRAPGEEEAAVREALVALSYQELLSLLSDPRWYEPLPTFPTIVGGFEAGSMRFMAMMCFMPHTPDALKAVIARPHNPPPLPPKPSWTLLLQFRWNAYFMRRAFRELIQREYALYTTSCQQFVMQCSKSLS